MAQIDVSELMVDPDFVDPVSLIHRVPTVDIYGQNSLVETTLATIGSVQPASGKTIQRLPEALRVADISEFFIKGTIVADGSNQYPDIIVFRGIRYQVQTVNDFSNWGAGYCQGTAVIEKPSQ